LAFLLAYYIAFALIGGGITFVGLLVFSVTSSPVVALAVVVAAVAGIALAAARIRHRLKVRGFHGLAVPT
jgi:cytochrome b subunit of formate dehydrogenase